MFEETQLLKGILEGCVLGIISKGETYGYEILITLEKYGYQNLGEGTLYPVLTRLHKNGYLECRKEKSPQGPIRKYYSITEMGREYLEAFKVGYQSITERANRILFDE